jgi:hypothetical protein
VLRRIWDKITLVKELPSGSGSLYFLPDGVKEKEYRNATLFAIGMA